MYGWLFGHVIFPLYETGLRRRNTLRYLRQLEEQQWLSSDEVRELQWRKLVRLLAHAEEHVPFYRDRMRRAGVTASGVESPDDLLRLPPLTKDDVRRHQQDLVSEGVSAADLYPSATGGSTGEPLHFMYDHDSYEWRVAGAARADRWAGWDWGRRQFYIWGRALHHEPFATRLKKRIHNRLLNMHIVSSFDFTDEVLDRYVREYNAFRPVVVVGYTNALYEFARHCQARKVELRAPTGVVATAERLYDHQRDLISRAFGAPVFDRYGCREMMNISAECDRHQGTHVNADNILLELERDGAHVPPGELGEVVVTDLNNYSMPFIRYKNGDLAVAKDGLCKCGRGLPLLERVEGRVLDVLVTPDGRYVPGEFFPHMLKDYAGISRYQVYQGKDYAIELRIVPGEGFQAGEISDIEQLTTGLLGAGVPFAVKLVDDIPRTAEGKLRVTVSEVQRAGGATAHG